MLRSMVTSKGLGPRKMMRGTILHERANKLTPYARLTCVDSD